jgi:hypothetical protein
MGCEWLSAAENENVYAVRRSEEIITGSLVDTDLLFAIPSSSYVDCLRRFPPSKRREVRLSLGLWVNEIPPSSEPAKRRSQSLQRADIMFGLI